jgi:hypothetical protein
MVLPQTNELHYHHRFRNLPNFPSDLIVKVPAGKLEPLQSRGELEQPSPAKSSRTPNSQPLTFGKPTASLFLLRRPRKLDNLFQVFFSLVGPSLLAAPKETPVYSDF